jgi:hypothetical protein
LMRWVERLIERLAGRPDLRDLTERLEVLRGDLDRDRSEIDAMRSRQDDYVRELSNMERMVEILSHVRRAREDRT